MCDLPTEIAESHFKTGGELLTTFKLCLFLSVLTIYVNIRRNKKGTPRLASFWALIR